MSGVLCDGVSSATIIEEEQQATPATPTPASSSPIITEPEGLSVKESTSLNRSPPFTSPTLLSVNTNIREDYRRRRSNDLRGSELKSHQKQLADIARLVLSSQPGADNSIECFEPLPIPTPDPFTEAEAHAEILYLATEFVKNRSRSSSINIIDDNLTKPSLTRSSSTNSTSSLINDIVTNFVDGGLKSKDLHSCKADDKGVALYDGEKVARAVIKRVISRLEEEPVEDMALPNCVVREVYYHAAQGRRATMEDQHVSFEDYNGLLGLDGYPPQSFFGVYDGHGGTEAAVYTRTHLHVNIAREESFNTDVIHAIKNGFAQTDSAFLRKAEKDNINSGCTVVTVLIRGRDIYVSWVGDSQMFVCCRGKPIELMKSHKPECEDEKKRIEDAGGVVVWYGAWRVNGVLAVARAIGDSHLKQFVISEPGVTQYTLSGDEEFMVLACDGLWDVMTREACIAFIKDHDSKNNPRSAISEAIVTHALSLGSCDNISVIVVFFHENL